MIAKASTKFGSDGVDVCYILELSKAFVNRAHISLPLQKAGQIEQTKHCLKEPEPNG